MNTRWHVEQLQNNSCQINYANIWLQAKQKKENKRNEKQTANISSSDPLRVSAYGIPSISVHCDLEESF